ncbi:hypothetical protein GS966_27810 [Rhodococcus hoagii]|nr:hypothetical protein [Prescottella equi]NKS62103.1 hypothetical protein [Prescottella equi]NKS68227.1 hypothetical protein [Prescottella equi]NKS98772.1 hypothetical protein [Prescottella equi]NKW53102.1 hypothetical protein [Prescottella equi]
MWHADRLPVEFTVASLILICVVAAIRLPFMRETFAERQINQFVFWAALSSLLREPAIATRLAPFVPGGTLIIFDMWHFAFLMTCVVCLSLFFFRDGRPIAEAQRLYHRWVVVGCAIGVSFFFLSHSARQKGMLLQDALGWQYAVYFSLYCFVPIVACLYALRELLSLRKRATDWREKTSVSIIFLIAVGGAYTMGYLALGAILATMGFDNSFTREVEIRAGGELILPYMALAFLIMIPSSAKALAQILRLDAVSQDTRTLEPMWRDLVVKATPGKILRQPWYSRWFTKPHVRNHRRRVEIHDAIGTVSRFAEQVPDELDELIEQTVPEDEQEDVYLAAELLLAARHLERVGGVKAAGKPRYGTREVADIDALVQVWDRARNLVDSVGTPAGVEVR